MATGAGAIGGGIAGGLSSGDKTTRQRSTRRVDIPEILQPLVEAQTGGNVDALARLNELLAPGSEGRLAAPFDPLQIEAQESAAGIARGAGGFIPAAQQGLLSTARGENLFGNPGFDEAVQASIRAATPNILSTFGRAGGTPGGLADVAIQQVASDAFARLFDSERGRQQQAQFGLPGAALQPSNILETIGGQRQAQQQREQLAPIEAINLLLDAARAGGINLTSLLGGTTTGSNTTPGIGPLAGGLLGALGGAQAGSSIDANNNIFKGGGGAGAGAAGNNLFSGAGGASAAGFAFSDSRVKEDIRKVGVLNNGLAVYAYRLKSGGPTQIGVMAQDVERVNAGAVVEIDGIKRVNYDLAVM